MAETIVQRDSEIEQMTNERNGEGLKHGMRVFVCSNQTVPKLTISHHLKEKNAELGLELVDCWTLTHCTERDPLSKSIY